MLALKGQLWEWPLCVKSKKRDGHDKINTSLLKQIGNHVWITGRLGWPDPSHNQCLLLHTSYQCGTYPMPYALWDGNEHARQLGLWSAWSGMPEVHCSCEYVKLLCGSILDAHTLARTNVKKVAKWQKRGYGETSRTTYFQCGDGVCCTYPLVSEKELRYADRGTRQGLVLAKTSPVIYKTLLRPTQWLYMSTIYYFIKLISEMSSKIGWKIENPMAIEL